LFFQAASKEDADECIKLTKKIATLESRRTALLGGGADALAEEKTKVRIDQHCHNSIRF
jgi:hypothetical protein